MATSMLAAVRDAIAGAAELSLDDEGKPGASAPQPQETGMSKDNPPAGGANAGVPQAEHDATVAAAETRGKEAGIKAATDRLTGILGAEGIKGNASRMEAALELATISPDMSAEAVTKFVAGKVPAAASYEEQRLADAGLSQPGKPKQKADHGWGEAVAQTNKRRG
jgi:hypothetical protein